jgi:glutathione S-transferase
MRECLDAINEFMGDGPYLFGDLPSSYDATLFAFLSALVHFPIQNPQVKIARGYPKIVDYCNFMREKYFSGDEYGGKAISLI